MKLNELLDDVAKSVVKKKEINTKRKNAEYGVFNWLVGKYIKRTKISEKKAEEIIYAYIKEKHPKVFNSSKTKELSSDELTTYICSTITHNFQSFTTWFKINKNQL